MLGFGIVCVLIVVGLAAGGVWMAMKNKGEEGPPPKEE